MRNRSIPNFNQVELAFLTEFIEGTFETALEFDTSLELPTTVKSQLHDIDLLLKTAFLDEKCARIIQIEDFRNDILEVILDRLDDNLNLYVEDNANDLSTVNLTPQEAIRLIPEYRASLEILGELPNGQPDFYSRGECAGHIWNEEHVRMLINRFESGEYEIQSEILGIAERLNELLAVDHRQELMIQECKIGESIEELRALRCKLHEFIASLYKTIYSEELRVKEKNIVSGVELVIDILKADQQSREDARFSANDLTHTEFYAHAAKKLAQDPLLKEFNDSLALLLGAEQGKAFEQNEAILYHSTERFIRELTIHLLCMEPAQNHPLREKIEQSSHFLYASELLKKICEQGTMIPADFSRGDPICGIDFPKFILALKNIELRDLLMTLRLRPLAEEIVEAESKARELSAVAVRRNRGLSLVLFRQVRADLTQRLINY